MSFIGRKKEIEILNRFIQKETASLIVVRGRRRIGKSRLIEEFSKQFKHYSFSGIAPTQKTTKQSQLDEAMACLIYQTKNGRIVILFDEISWMGSKDPEFLSKLKNIWDQNFKKNNKLILILCGSASSWIEKNILSSTGFLGRISHTLTLGELKLPDCHQFWGKYAHNLSAQEKFKMLAVTGGVPRYLEEINKSLSAEENIKNLCFTRGALLVDEFNNIFSNVFLRKSDTYRKLVEIISTGPKEFNEICKILNHESNGRILEYLEELVLSGFVKRDYSFNIKNGVDSKLSKFRLSDNYLRFYIKYISKYKTKIERNSFEFKSLSNLENWYSIMGFQFENLVLNNKQYIWKALNISPDEIVSENPFFQRKTARQPGCQIDYLIQTKFSTLYICEIKFSKHSIPIQIIDEVQKKIDNLIKPKCISCRPVLIHVNGAAKDIEEADYFTKIIDFSKAINNEERI